MIQEERKEGRKEKMKGGEKKNLRGTKKVIAEQTCQLMRRKGMQTKTQNDSVMYTQKTVEDIR